MSNIFIAYAVSFSGVTGIVFAENEYGALTEGARLMDISINQITSCNRLPWADPYAGGDIPAAVMYANDWVKGPWSQCVTCKAQVYKGSHDEQGNLHDPVFEGSRLYCSTGCHVDSLMEAYTINERRRLREAAAKDKFPGASRIAATGFPDDPVVTFRFQGAAYDTQWDTSTGQVFVQQHDVPAWHQYRQAVANGALG